MTSKNNLTFRTTGIFLFLFALSEIGYADSIPLAYRYLESPNSCNMDITHGSDHRNVEKINLKIVGIFSIDGTNCYATYNTDNCYEN